jgi:hypothetical protein
MVIQYNEDSAWIQRHWRGSETYNSLSDAERMEIDMEIDREDAADGPDAKPIASTAECE